MPLHALGNLRPVLPPKGTYWIAPDARIIGNVRLGEGCTVWFAAVLRGDNDLIDIGARSNVQDGAVIHVDPGFPVKIGEECSIGHSAVIHGCTIGDGSLIGMGSTILNGAEIGPNCLVGANALVTGGTIFPEGSMILGSPAKRVRALTEAEIARCRTTAHGYVRNLARYGAEFGAAFEPI